MPPTHPFGEYRHGIMYSINYSVVYKALLKNDIVIVFCFCHCGYDLV